MLPSYQVVLAATPVSPHAGSQLQRSLYRKRINNQIASRIHIDDMIVSNLVAMFAWDGLNMHQSLHAKKDILAPSDAISLRNPPRSRMSSKWRRAVLALIRMSAALFI